MLEHRLFDGGLLDEAGPEVAALLDRLSSRDLPRPGDRVSEALEMAADAGLVAPVPGQGQTLVLWDLLARLGAYDLTVARTLEPHLDARAILGATPVAPDLDIIDVDEHSTWGVYAAEGPGGRLHARSDGAGEWRVTGHKPWCSLASRLSHALVTAWTGDSTRRLFAVPLTHPGVHPDAADGWVARGLAGVASVGVTFEEVPAVPVGADGWYLDRPGFAWGGMGVAACWYGGVAAVAGRLLPRRGGREPDQIALMHLGTVDAQLYAARSTLRDAAASVDAGSGSPSDPGSECARRAIAGPVTAWRVRHVVARACEDVLSRTARATGPGPLALEDEHARRVLDLDLYLRQEHAERDAAALGAAVRDLGTSTGRGSP